jgi:hypothetical protein
MASVWNLTPVTEKAISEINKKISSQKAIIEKAEAVNETKGDTFRCSRAKVTLESLKAKLAAVPEKIRQLELKEREYEEKIEVQEKIIWEEREREPSAIIAARTQLAILETEKRKVLAAAGVRLPSFTPARESEDSPEPEPEVTVADFFRETRLDGTPIAKSFLDAPFKYVESLPPGLVSKRKTEYGPISDLQEAARKARAENKS